LVITLKRFTPCGQYKINALVDFPLDNFDLSSYVSGYNASSYVYELYGICNHIGGTSGGHYTSFVKNANEEWLHFNDSHVEKVGDVNQIINPLAYCLFYRRKNKVL
jgi:ubiquitin C-terminal hydrolase